MNRKLIEKDLIPIFAVGEHVMEKYQKLSDHLTQLSQVGWYLNNIVFSSLFVVFWLHEFKIYNMAK